MKHLLARLRTAFSKPAPEPARQQEHQQTQHQQHEPQSDAAEDEVLINAYCTVWDFPALDFPHTLAGRRDLSDPELAPHLSGFVGYVLGRGDGQMTRNRYHAMRHIQRVQQHLSLGIAPAQLDAFAGWAQRANAIAFLNDGSIRDPQGRILLDANGAEPDDQAALPYPQQAWQRKQRSEQALAQRGFTPAASLPPLISEPELRMRAPDEIAARAFALLTVAVRAESLNGGEPLTPEQLFQRLPAAQAALTPNEREFMATARPSEEAIAKFGWRYEAAYLLEWALGLVDTLPFPDAICDVPLTSRTLLQAGALHAARMRPDSEILDALDQHYRLHWIVRQAQVQQQPAPAGLSADVLMERHHALNWLVRFEGNDWDDVDTPT
ncbi:DUF4272 domain-containing protein [Delftia sp. UME58]|uniref:DUF4272 domain-containing protein n=1 Tax=Delftia sp. UME58 TaxID=1862322 RepID=UPI0015FF8020|nr:DUF4272 domain-containing protein [Delftia sp. UME58]MBB1649251.1 hypothetical protein [Delftia sp. UME58]